MKYSRESLPLVYQSEARRRPTPTKKQGFQAPESLRRVHRARFLTRPPLSGANSAASSVGCACTDAEPFFRSMIANPMRGARGARGDADVLRSAERLVGKERVSTSR